MSLDSTTIDRIVAGVLQQLGGDVVVERGKVTRVEQPIASPKMNPPAIGGAVVTLNERVVTAEVLEAAARGATRVLVGAKTIVTPAAWDVARELGLAVQRGTLAKAAAAVVPAAKSQHSTIQRPLLVVVHHTDSLARVWDDLQSRWQRELRGCPDDAAQLAITELARGGVPQVVIAAEQTYRAACLANRHGSVKAVGVNNAFDVKQVRQQLRANVWCINPKDKSWYELRQVFKAIDSGH
ncbi:MAG: hypothetical protein R3B90_14030 [Planctomycetaceae bacterium]